MRLTISNTSQFDIVTIAPIFIDGAIVNIEERLFVEALRGSLVAEERRSVIEEIVFSASGSCRTMYGSSQCGFVSFSDEDGRASWFAGITLWRYSFYGSNATLTFGNTYVSVG